MTEKVFFNDGLVDIEEAAISVRDGGFLYGAGLFETMRSYNGVVFRLNDHLDRLFSSAEKLAVNNTCGKDYIADAIYQLLNANDLQDARLRLTLTSGPVSLSDQPPASTLLITAAKIEPYPQDYYKNGILAVLCPFRQNPFDPTCGHKTVNYFSRITGLNLARQKHAAEAIWFTVDNRLAEGCISNVFLVKNNSLLTPKLDTPVLPGIMRKTVLEIAASNGIDVTEKDLYINDCLEADEIFMTNVIMQIMPVNKLEQHAVGEGKAGQMVSKLRQHLEQLITGKSVLQK